MDNLLDLSAKTLSRRRKAAVERAKNEVLKSKKPRDKSPTSSCSDEDIVISDSDSSVYDSNSSDSEESFTEDQASETVIDKLRQFFVEENINARMGNRLLPILHYAGLTYLPKTHETLMKTEGTRPDIKTFPDGEYIYFGLEKPILEKLERLDYLPDATEIKIDINIDGTPLTKSSGKQFWPVEVMIKIKDFAPFEPFEAGIFCSPSIKPKQTDFLNDFVQEAKHLEETGLVLKNVKFSVKINLFICDTPGFSMILKTKGHTGFESCRKCIVHGVTIKGRRVFPETDEDLRTDWDFRNQIYPKHHVGKSILE